MGPWSNRQGNDQTKKKKIPLAKTNSTPNKYPFERGPLFIFDTNLV